MFENPGFTEADKQIKMSGDKISSYNTVVVISLWILSALSRLSSGL